MNNTSFAAHLNEINTKMAATAAAEGWTYIPETVEEWADRGVTSAVERKNWWAEVEAMEQAKEWRKSGYAA